MAIKIKKPEDIALMVEGGKITALALRKVLDAAKTGAVLADLDKIAEEIIITSGAKPSFKMVEDYKFTTCLNVNEGIVHGIPNNYALRDGDVLSVDLGAFYKGFHTDLSYSVEIATNKEQKFLQAGENALNAAIAACTIGKHIGDISNSIQQIIQKAGYTVSTELVGHGVGKDLHEDPYIPGYGKKNTGPEIKEGMVFAIEVIYQKGSPKLALERDGWTLRTADRSLSGLFEHTVAVTKNGSVVITKL
ncbi:MAG: hypothetical protein ACD_22C00184G0012 [uncultured bacterium]|nr:MAG: hypothetical protein ACD_22C00184G0012 [uncultured bacterium]